MRIGIITPYDAANCGAYLQAYASMKFLQSHGHDVIMIKWRSDRERKAAFFENQEPISLIIKSILVQPRIDKISIMLKAIINHWRALRKYRVMTKALREFDIIDFRDIEKYKFDMITIGSDIVWDISMPIFQNPVFYGKNLPSDISCCAYAPSAGECTAKDFIGFPEHQNGIKEMNIIGVRDINTQKIIETMADISPEIVCDPTMLIDISEYDISSKPLVKDKYLLVYSYHVTEEYRKYLKRYAAEHKLKLVAVFLYQGWCDINITCSPLEFCKLVKEAECVFTSTFHGSIFTLLNHKRCIIMAKTKKVEDLLKWTNMEEIKVDDNTKFEQIEKKLSNYPEYTRLEQKLEIQRSKSRGLYEEALKRVERQGII